jgi:hypothetical protein
MKFELTSRNLSTFKVLSNRLLFNDSIQSVIFDDGLKIVVYLEKNKLADFAVLVKDLDVFILEDTTIRRLK